MGGNCLSFFNQNIPHFQQSHFTIAYSVRGYGRSELGGGDTAIFDAKYFGSDTIAVLDAEERTEPVVIVGHSYGGLSTVRAAMEYPGRVGGVCVFSNTFVAFTNESIQKIVLLIDTQTRADTADAAVAVKPLTVDPERQSKPGPECSPGFSNASATFVESRPVFHALMSQIKDMNVHVHNLKLMGKIYGSVTGSDSLTTPSDSSERFNKPIHFVCSNEDTAAPWELVEYVASQCGTGVSVQFFGGCVGHSPYFELPDKYDANLADFLGRIF